jgi:hypothetical protein
MDPAAVKAGEAVTAQSYRQIEAPRDGMQLAPITSGTIGSELAFASPVDGMFTRNVVSQSGKLFAEIKPT